MREYQNNLDTAVLRQRAEELLKKKPLKAGSLISEFEALKLVHELELNQIELELQNEELQLAKENAIELAAEKFAELYDFAPSGYFTLSQSDTIIDLNLSGAEMLGEERSCLKNCRFGFFVSDDTKPFFNHFLEEVFRSNSKLTCEVTLINNGKMPMYVYLIGIATKNVEYCYVTAIDITEQKLAEEKILKLEQYYQALTEKAFDGLVLLDAEAKFKFVSPATRKMFGYSDSDAITQNPAEMTHPEDLDMVLKNLTQLFEDPSYVPTLQYRFAHKNGTWMWVETTFCNYLADPNVESIVLNFRDITERKRVEETLEKLKKAIYTSGEAIFLTDREGVFTFVNPAFTALYGYSSEEVIGKLTPRIIKSGLMKPKDYEMFWKTLLSGQEARGELINKRKDETILYVDGSASPIFDEMNNIVGFLGIQRDITERIQSEKELFVALEHAEESDRLKSAFLANMSHEIRTPMNGILGFAELLKEPDLSGEQQQKYVAIMQKSGDRMLNIINNIVDISKIESGQMKVSISSTNINEKIGYIHTYFKPEAEDKGITLSFKNGLSANEAIIKTDREKVYVILSNLVKNAIKYCDKGTIEFGYELVAETSHATSPQDTESSLQFYVTDTGIGIPKNRQQSIFDRFVQADIVDKMAREGAGLGLSISKAYVEMLGGKIWVESEVGKGSTFYFTLPYNAEHEEEIHSKNIISVDEAMALIKKLKILIAEDDEQ